jgi:hypothetical protein
VATESRAIPKTELTLDDIKRLRLEPGDILVLTFPNDVTRDAASVLLDAARQATGTEMPILGLVRDVEMHVIDDDGTRQWLRGLIADEVSKQLAATVAAQH